MKCVAIGDMFLSEEAFAKELKKDTIFTSYQGFTWMEGIDRVNARTIIRNIETQGSTAYHLKGEMKEALLEAEAIFIHLCPIGEEIIAHAPNLKYVVTARGGVENIDVECAKKHGVKVIHCPIHNAYAVAEICIGMMICETRNIVRANISLKEGVWREAFPNSGKIRELRSCTIGLIGFGAIGRLVAERLKPFQANILIHDPFLPAEEIEALGYHAVSKEELLKNSDIVSLHGRIGPKDPPIIGKEELEAMKNTSYLINTARAVLVDMDALYEALSHNVIGGAAIDVFRKEPVDKEDPLLTLDNITLTNHRGGDTLDSYERSPEILLEQLKEVLTTGKTRYMI